MAELLRTTLASISTKRLLPLVHVSLTHSCAVVHQSNSYRIVRDKVYGFKRFKNGREKDNCFKQETLLMTSIPSCAQETVVFGNVVFGKVWCQ